MSTHGTCKECNQENIWCKWCKACDAKYFRQNFKNWTSGSDDIDKFIQDAQLSANNYHKIIEWIPYDRFYNIKYIASGGFGTVFSANWTDGYISKWNKGRIWKRKGHQMNVALKSLKNSKNVTQEFIKEITFHHKIEDVNSFIVKFYGVTQDPNTKNYMMILDYADHGSLRKHLNTNYNKLNWDDKLRDLWRIAVGIEKIHEKGLIHRDLHTGNILSFSYNAACITDMGLCKPANCDELENAKNSIYGVLSYIAPEVLRGRNYTKASDIYSFGIVIYEMISGLPPYHDIGHDEYLAIKICQGFRPRFNIKVPQLIVNLIKRCLDADPLKRPTAKEIRSILWTWRMDDNLELMRQIKEAEKVNPCQPIPSTDLKLSFETHSGVNYTSRLLNFVNLPCPRNSYDYYDNYYNIISTQFSESLQISVS